MRLKETAAIKTDHQFVTETDTEIIAHLIEEYLNPITIEQAVRRAMLDLKGISALSIINATNRTCHCCQQGPPVVIGLGDREFLWPQIFHDSATHA